MMNRRRFAIAGMATAAAAAAPGAFAQSGKTVKLRLAQVPAVGNLSIYVADTQGFFTQEGIDFEGIPINSGPGAASAVVSKSADLGFGGILPTIIARSEGVPLRFVLGGYYEQESVFSDTAIIASPKSGISTVADLKGKTVAVNNAGGINDLQVRLKLAQAGVPLDTVKILTVPFPQMQAALEIGNTDAVATVEPFRTAILQKKIGKVIAHGYVRDQDLGKPVPIAGFYGTDEWIQGNADTLGRLQRAITKANAFIKANPSDSKKILMQRLRLPQELVEAISLPPFNTQIDQAGIQAVIDAAQQSGILKKPVQVSQVLAASAMK